MHRQPRLEIVPAPASPQEAAAIVAALECFMRDTAPERHPSAPRRPAWASAALLEATGHEPTEADRFAWGTRF